MLPLLMILLLLSLISCKIKVLFCDGIVILYSYMIQHISVDYETTGYLLLSNSYPSIQTDCNHCYFILHDTNMILSQPCSYRWQAFIRFNIRDTINIIRCRRSCRWHPCRPHIRQAQCTRINSCNLHVLCNSRSVFLPHIWQCITALEHRSHVHHRNVCEWSICSDNNSSVC